MTDAVDRGNSLTFLTERPTMEDLGEYAFMKTLVRALVIFGVLLVGCGGGSSNPTDSPRCPASQADCSGTCASLNSDNANCGACGNACPAGNVCSNGSCQLSCQQGLDDCSGTCANLMSDTANCGACGTACAAGEVCSNGQCALSCQQGLDDCSGTCANLMSDNANCGACGTVCSAGEVCSNGQCALSCQQGLTDCNGVCTNLLTDNADCGQCGTVCSAGNVCSSGTCALSCQAGLTNCNGTCDNLMTDIANCGGCGDVCPAGNVCSGGVCAVSCQQGLTSCSGTCTNLTFDPSNCGTCGTTCGVSQACVAGTCVDEALYAPVGPQQNVPITSLSGWTQCYSDTYNVDMGAVISNIQTACSGAKILMACRPHNASTLTLLAWGQRSDVFFDTGAGNNQGHTAGPVVWYFNANYSWGFATAGDALDLNQCDENGGADRLCWHTINASGGYRCGDTINLNGSTAWDRLIFQAN
jgi:hypothetical protein